MRITGEQQQGKRPAFTLVEILVVIAIVAVLIALVAAGIMAVYGTQRRTNTENAMRGLSKVLKAHMKHVIDKAGKEASLIPQSVRIMADGNSDRAMVIWKKLRLKQEFPMTFAEALAPYANWAGSGLPNALSPADLPPVPAYIKALAAAGIIQSSTGATTWTAANAGTWSVVPGNKGANSAVQPFQESSTLIILALQQNRGGADIPSDILLSYARDINGDGLKELLDGWNNPIAFFRFPTSNDLTITSTNANNGALDATNPAPAGSTQATYRDPDDQQGLLVNEWNQFLNYNGGGKVAQFEALCHLIHAPNASAGAAGPTGLNYQPWPRFMTPTLVSAGADGKWGLASSFTGYAAVNPDMSLDAGTVAAANDNIYSYTLNLNSAGN